MVNIAFVGYNKKYKNNTKCFYVYLPNLYYLILISSNKYTSKLYSPAAVHLSCTCIVLHYMCIWL